MAAVALLEWAAFHLMSMLLGLWCWGLVVCLGKERAMGVLGPRLTLYFNVTATGNNNVNRDGDVNHGHYRRLSPKRLLLLWRLNELSILDYRLEPHSVSSSSTSLCGKKENCEEAAQR